MRMRAAAALAVALLVAASADAGERLSSEPLLGANMDRPRGESTGELRGWCARVVARFLPQCAAVDGISAASACSVVGSSSQPQRDPSPVHIAVVLGTRPEAVKVFPVVRLLRACPGDAVRVTVLNTGQHEDLLHSAMDALGVGADVTLAGTMRAGQSLGSLTARLLAGLDDALASLAPDAVMVQGDTTTAYAAAVAAFYRRIPVAHLEAGLRTHDMHNPFPEEFNRRSIGAVASLHLAPTAQAARSLLGEGVPQSTVFVTGNTALDTTVLVASGVATGVVDAESRAEKAREASAGGGRVGVGVGVVGERPSLPEPVRAVLDASGQCPGLRAVRRGARKSRQASLAGSAGGGGFGGGGGGGGGGSGDDGDAWLVTRSEGSVQRSAHAEADAGMEIRGDGSVSLSMHATHGGRLCHEVCCSSAACCCTSGRASSANATAAIAGAAHTGAAADAGLDWAGANNRRLTADAGGDDNGTGTGAGGAPGEDGNARFDWSPDASFDDEALALAAPAPRGRLVLVTMHRRENLGAPMRRVCRALLRVARAHPEVQVVFPTHANPRVRDVVEADLAAAAVGEGLANVHVVPPLGYETFTRLLGCATLVLTDSGGVQEEATAFRCPVLVLRNATERREGVRAGVSAVVGTDEDAVAAATLALLRPGSERLRAMRHPAFPYGDGRAAFRVVPHLLRAALRYRRASGAGAGADVEGAPIEHDDRLMRTPVGGRVEWREVDGDVDAGGA